MSLHHGVTHIKMHPHTFRHNCMHTKKATTSCSSFQKEEDHTSPDSRVHRGNLQDHLVWSVPCNEILRISCRSLEVPSFFRKPHDQLTHTAVQTPAKQQHAWQRKPAVRSEDVGLLNLKCGCGTLIYQGGDHQIWKTGMRKKTMVPIHVSNLYTIFILWIVQYI